MQSPSIYQVYLPLKTVDVDRNVYFVAFLAPTSKHDHKYRDNVFLCCSICHYRAVPWIVENLSDILPASVNPMFLILLKQISFPIKYRADFQFWFDVKSNRYWEFYFHLVWIQHRQGEMTPLNSRSSWFPIREIYVKSIRLPGVLDIEKGSCGQKCVLWGIFSPDK